jgi:UDP-N-acetylmuramoylalanine--D-glutamate ligase
MIDLSFMAGSTIAVLGLGKTGTSAAHALMQGGAKVWAWDDNEKQRAEHADLPIADLGDCDWSRVAALVLSPGIPHSFPKPHPAVSAAKAAGVPIYGDIELLIRAQPAARFVGITGTNGKSTTTALLGHILKEAALKAEVGGNLGTPVLTLKALERDGVYVMELSSYQLELTPSLNCDVAVLLNITPDHIDRHGSMAGYIAAKRLVFRSVGKTQTAVIATDDELCRHIAAELAARGHHRVIPISAVHRTPHGVWCERTLLHDTDGQVVLDLARAPALPGAHNAQNAAAAFAAARALGLDAGVIAAAILTFPGLAHRQERIAALDGVSFVNDSKATNAEAAAKALVCYDHIYWIAGGVAKEGGINTLESYFPRIRHAFLIGQAAEPFAKTLGGNVPHSLVGDLEHAVQAAYAMARRDGHHGAVVLLSPACASFDQYPGFEARGAHFRELVGRIASERAA